MENYVFGSLAQLRILLLPVGPISKAAFDDYAGEIRSFEEIRLSDIPADTKDEKVRFMPKPLQTGSVHLSFTSRPPPESHSSMALFRPSHFPLGVIGVASCDQAESLSSVAAQFNASMRRLFPQGSTFPLAKSCFVFEDDASNTNLNLGDTYPGLVIIPSIMGNKKLYIGTLLADLCSQIIGEFGQLTHTLESPLGNEYLNASLFPTLPPLSEIPPSLEQISNDSVSSLHSINSQSDLGRLTKSPPPRRTSTVMGYNPSPPPSRQSTLGVPNVAKKRQSGIGVASSPGRLFKVTADLYLLAGRTEDASIWYSEALITLKAPIDSVWHASALEGLATVTIIEAWSSGHGLNTSNTTSMYPWHGVAERLNQATAIYFKASPTSEEHSHEQYTLLSYLYSSCVLRHASLLFSIWSAKGWGPLAFTTMFASGLTSQLPSALTLDKTADSSLQLERLSSLSGVPRSAIATTLAQAHGPWLLHIGPGERISILEALASLYGFIGYQRKEAYILREVVGCIMDLIAVSREEEAAFRRSSNPISPNASGLAIQGIPTPNGNKESVGVRQNESKAGNESILRLLKHICKVLGVDLELVKLVDMRSDGKPQRDSLNGEPLVDDASALMRFGWPELKIGVVREALFVAEALPDHPAVAQFSLSALRALRLQLSDQDQYTFYEIADRALKTSKRRGSNRAVEFWSDQPVFNIEVQPLPLIRMPMEKPISVLTPRANDHLPIITGVKDPFLYNPRKGPGGKAKVLVVQNEPLEFTITLQNVYGFGLELQTLALSTSGVPFESKPTSLMIPPRSSHSVTVIGRPLQSGTLIIRGCIVQAPGGAPREFGLPIYSEEDEVKASRRRSAILGELGRSKHSGLLLSLWKKGDKRTSAGQPVKDGSLGHPLELQVVPEQPLLRIRRTSLTHGAVMLYKGEISTIRLTLENVSSLPIDFLRISFDDSTIGPAQQALQDGDLPVFDVYETEYDLIHRRAFTWRAQDDFKELRPGAKTVVNVTCLGKSNCTSGTIHLSYSYVHRPKASLDAPPSVFHTRQLDYSVLVTVYQMLECLNMDILPFNGNEDRINGVDPRDTALQIGSEPGWCLFTIDVRNVYGIPFDVTFERVQDDLPPISTTLTIAPGSTSRAVLPIKQFLLPEDEISKPIPTLTDRQFVVDKTGLSSSQEQAQRELFWYRETLFKCIQGRWKESEGTRTGDLNLRRQRLSWPMLEALKTEKARLHLSLISYDEKGEEKTLDQKTGKFFLSPDEFIYLRTKVMNISSSPLLFTLDISLEPADHIIYEGVLVDMPVGLLEAGESGIVETGICFLARGRYEAKATARALRDIGGTIASGKGSVIAVVEDSHS